jgi:hypothetical protein
MTADKRTWLAGTFPQWIVTGLLSATLVLGTAVWEQQNARIARLEVLQEKAATEELERVRALATLEARGRSHDLAISEIKVGMKEIVVEVKQLNHLLRDRKL